MGRLLFFFLLTIGRAAGRLLRDRTNQPIDGRYPVRKTVTTIVLCSLLFASPAPCWEAGETIETTDGELAITCVGHGSLLFSWSGITIHVDPWSRQGDYESMPDADIILITHHHRDHLDGEAIRAVQKDETVTILTRSCADKGFDGLVMDNGDSMTVMGIPIRAVPAYNIEHKREDGSPYHPKGDGNGYLIRFAETVVYVAGDTEPIPEMADLGKVDIAFLPMNLPYTMSPEMAAEAARLIRPRILYPYHYGETDTNELVEMLAGTPEIEVRIR